MGQYEKGVVLFPVALLSGVSISDIGLSWIECRVSLRTIIATSEDIGEYGTIQVINRAGEVTHVSAGDYIPLDQVSFRVFATRTQSDI